MPTLFEIFALMSRRAQVRSDSIPLSTPSTKRPRANEDHEASIPKAKVTKSNKCDLYHSDIVPSNAPGLVSAKATTNGDSSTPKPHTGSIDRNTDTVRSLPGNGNSSTPGPYMGAFTVETHSLAVSPVLTNGSSTLGPHMGTFTAQKNDKTVTARTDIIAASDTPKIDQVSKTTSRSTATSVHPNASTAHRDIKSAADNVQRRNEARGSTPTRNAHGKPSESSLALQDDRSSKNHSQPPVSTAALLCDLSRWIPTPYTLIEAGEGKSCPRVEVSPDNGLSRILGVGQHPIATAIAKIHLYGHEKSVPKEAHQVLNSFDDIYRHYRGSQHITLLDPLLYDSVTYDQVKLEAFRKKEWAWLVRAGKPITFPNQLLGSWEFITIQTNYQRLEVALVLSRGDDQMTYLPHLADPPQDLGPIQLYENPPHGSLSPVPPLPREAWEDIAFCQRWIPAFESEDICVVIRFQYQPALAPHHIDEIARATFRGIKPLDCTYYITWALNLKECEKAARTARIMRLRLQAFKLRCSHLSVVGW